MKSTAFGVFEDLKFKISEGYKQNFQSLLYSVNQPNSTNVEYVTK